MSREEDQGVDPGTLTLKGGVKEDDAVRASERQGRGEEAPRVALSS